MILFLYHYDTYSIYSVDKELNAIFAYEFSGGVVSGYIPITFNSDGGYSMHSAPRYTNAYSINDKIYGIDVNGGKITFLELDSSGKVVNEFPLSGYSVDQHDSSVGPPMYDSGDAVYFYAFDYYDGYLCRFDGEKYEMIICLDDYKGFNHAAFDYICVTDTGFRCYCYQKKGIIEFLFE